MSEERRRITSELTAEQVAVIGQAMTSEEFNRMVIRAVEAMKVPKLATDAEREALFMESINADLTDRHRGRPMFDLDAETSAAVDRTTEAIQSLAGYFDGEMARVRDRLDRPHGWFRAVRGWWGDRPRLMWQARTFGLLEVFDTREAAVAWLVRKTNEAGDVDQGAAVMSAGWWRPSELACPPDWPPASEGD